MKHPLMVIVLLVLSALWVLALLAYDKSNKEYYLSLAQRFTRPPLATDAELQNATDIRRTLKLFLFLLSTVVGITAIAICLNW
jgi:hypothetical protein